MKENFFTFILTIFILVILGGIGYIAYYYFYVGDENLVSEIVPVNEISNEPIKPIEPIEQNQQSSESTELLPIDSGDGNTQITQVTSGKYKYYYNQLDSNAKKIYDKLESNIENIKTGNAVLDFDDEFNDLLNQEQGQAKLNEAYQSALDAFSLDNPEVYYIDVTNMVLMIYSRTNLFGTTYTTAIEPVSGGDYLIDSIANKDDLNSKLAEIEYVKNSVVEQTSADDDYTKIKKIHDFLISHMEYDQTLERTNTRNIYGALVEKSVVCEGYADALKYLLDAVGIPCVEVVGTGTNSAGETEAHAWNYVQLNGAWYAIDVTWDDPTIIGNGRVPKSTYTKYFLRGSKKFNDTHFANGQVSEGGRIFTYPALSEKDYN